MPPAPPSQTGRKNTTEPGEPSGPEATDGPANIGEAAGTTGADSTTGDGGVGGPTGTAEPPAAPEPTEEAGSDGASETTDAAVPTEKDTPSADLADGAPDAVADAATNAIDGDDAHGGLEQSESGEPELELLQGEGFSYAVLTGEEGLEEGELNAFHVGDKSAYYYGPGVYV